MSADLQTQYMGLELANPLVVGACPLTRDTVVLQQLEQEGAAAVVMPSLFEEQIEQQTDEFYSSFNPIVKGDLPPPVDTGCVGDMSSYNAGPDACLKRIEMAKKCLSIPVIGSLNAQSKGGWTKSARLIEQAGADALELNIYFVPTDPAMTTAAVENRHVEIVQAVRESITIPLAVKIGPYFAALPNFTQRLVDSGADGVVLFNRFLEPEFDLDTFDVVPQLELSQRCELRLALRWIAILSGQVDSSLAATGGIHETSDVIRALLAGADVAMLVSALLEHGPTHLKTLVSGLQRWLDDHGRKSVAEIQGLMSRQRSPDGQSFERANYMRALSGFTADFT